MRISRSGTKDLPVLEPAVQPAKDRGTVAADVEDLVALRLQVAVKGFGKTSPDTYFLGLVDPMQGSIFLTYYHARYLKM